MNQVALAWALSKGDSIAPIPGTRRVARLEENLVASAGPRLWNVTRDVLRVIGELPFPGTGARHGAPRPDGGYTLRHVAR
jgi:hypothetical protein